MIATAEEHLRGEIGQMVLANTDFTQIFLNIIISPKIK